MTVGKRIKCYWRNSSKKWYQLTIIKLKEDRDKDGWWVVGMMDNGTEIEEFLITREGKDHYWKEV